MLDNERSRKLFQVCYEQVFLIILYLSMPYILRAPEHRVMFIYSISKFSFQEILFSQFHAHCGLTC